ncbi:hypothetical protein TNCV_5004231 [Trichonephila clavipes]|nr:hypothetical protein TNCV_5004231 [Trichonephila clavipes]
MRDSIITSHDPIREHPLSSPVLKAEISARPRTFPQRLAQPISFLLLAGMTTLWSDLHKHTGYGMGGSLREPYARYCTEGTEGEIQTRRFFDGAVTLCRKFSDLHFS